MKDLEYLIKMKNRYLELTSSGVNELDAGNTILSEFNHMDGHETGEYSHVIIIYKNSYLLNLEVKAIYQEVEIQTCVNCDQETYTHSICGECLNKIINENK